MNRPIGLFPVSSREALRDRTVLQIVPSLDAGGAERTTIDIAAGLAEAGVRALVASEGGRLVAELQAKGGEWLRFPAATKNPLKLAANAVRLKRLCRHEGVALIHARSRAPAWSALRAARALRVTICDHISRHLFQPRRPEATLQFGHGTWRRRSCQFALHGRV